MTIDLRSKFESVLYKWGVAIYLIIHFGISDLLFSDPFNWFNVVALTALFIYLFLENSKVKVTVLDNQQIDYYWGIFGFKFGLKRIHKSEVKELAIVQLPSCNYALVLKLMGQSDILLIKANNKRNMTTQVNSFLANFNDQEFFPQFETVTYPPISYVEKQILPDKPLDNTNIRV